MSAVTSLLQPITGFIPAAEFARRIVGPPSSLMTSEEKEASRNELSFRHVVGRGARADHAEAMEWLRRCNDLSALVSIEQAVLVHRIERGPFAATGLIADVSLAAYDDGRIKRHEATVAKTERKMVEYMQSTRIFGNPVALAHLDQADVAQSIRQLSDRAADVRFEAVDGANHSLWVITGERAHDLCEMYTDTLYITDGHHRLAAASTLARAEGRANPHLPAALFAESELQLGAYSRSIVDETVAASNVLSDLSDRFVVEEVPDRVPRPRTPHEIGMRLDGRSYLFSIPDELVPQDVYAALDVNLLQVLVLEPVFGVTNQRTDSRLQFVADTSDASHDVDAADAWFLPYPTSVRDVMAVADSGRSMPPKSTFFMPKVPSGLIVRPVDQD